MRKCSSAHSKPHSPALKLKFVLTTLACARRTCSLTQWCFILLACAILRPFDFWIGFDTIPMLLPSMNAAAFMVMFLKKKNWKKTDFKNTFKKTMNNYVQVRNLSKWHEWRNTIQEVASYIAALGCLPGCLFIAAHIWIYILCELLDRMIFTAFTVQFVYLAACSWIEKLWERGKCVAR